MEDTAESPYVKIWKEDTIMRCVFADNLNMNIEIAKLCVSKRIALSQGMDQLCLIDMRGIRSADKQARDYLAAEGARLVKAGALIISSPLSRMLGNIFLTINKPGVPVKLFTQEEEARAWLKAHL